MCETCLGDEEEEGEKEGVEEARQINMAAAAELDKSAENRSIKPDRDVIKRGRHAQSKKGGLGMLRKFLLNRKTVPIICSPCDQKHGYVTVNRNH